MPNASDVTLAEAGERFTADIAGHQLTVLRDDGLYRHLRFLRVLPDPATGKLTHSSLYWFEVVTWPGALAVSSDMGGYLFRRTDDMIAWLRGQRPNPGYWAEKLPGGHDSVTGYSEDVFRQHVMDVAAEQEADWPGLTAAVEAEFFGPAATWNPGHEEDARKALEQFTFGSTFEPQCICGEKQEPFPDYEAARVWLVSHVTETGAGHRALRITTTGGFRFTDTWEWDLRGYSYQFLWICHALPWAIAQYDQHQAARSGWRGWARRVLRTRRG